MTYSTDTETISVNPGYTHQRHATKVPYEIKSVFVHMGEAVLALVGTQQNQNQATSMATRRIADASGKLLRFFASSYDDASIALPQASLPGTICFTGIRSALLSKDRVPGLRSMIQIAKKYPCGCQCKTKLEIHTMVLSNTSLNAVPRGKTLFSKS